MLPRRQFLTTSGGAAAAAFLATSFTACGAEDAKPRPLRIGQIGTQHGHAAGKMETLRRLREHFEVVGLAGADDKAGTAFAGIPRLTLTQLLALPDLDAVVVETDFPDACAAAHAAVRAGRHVHLDKPGALDHAAFSAMRQDAAQRGLVFQMGYMLRYNPAFQLAARAVTAGWFGRITELDAMMGKKLDPAGRKDLLRIPGGGMFELGCHLVDTVCTLLGKPQDVQCLSLPAGTDGFQDNQLALLHYPTAVATLRCNMADPFGNPRRRFQITGTEGGMEIAPLESGRITLRLTKPHGEYKAGEHHLTIPVPPGRYDAELTAFANAVRTKTPLPWSAEHDLTVHETALRAAGVK
jgi:predicted dehydrogenase